MRYLTLPLAVVFAFSLTAACDDSDGGGGGGDGGANSSNGGNGSGATINSGAGEPGAGGGDSPGMGGGTSACAEEAETLKAELGAFGAGLTVSETSIAYVTRLDAGTPTDLSVMAHDGSGDGVIYSSAEGFAIGSVTWSGEDVLFLEAADGETANALYTVPGAGGEAVQVGTDTFEDARLLGADADSAYLYQDGLPMAVILRVTLADGTVETIAAVPAPGTIMHPVFAGDEIFFLGGSALESTVYRVATTDTGADPTEVFTSADNPGCGFPQGGLVATPTKLVCGYVDVAAVARDDGTSEGVIVEGDLVNGPGNIVVASSEESIYTIEFNDGKRDTTMRRVSSDGSNEVPLVCDVGRVATQLTDGFFPISNHYQIGVGGGRLVWVEERVSEDDVVSSTSIRSAPL
jgi:hypothetical protein